MPEALTHLMTVAEYQQIPENNKTFYYELRHGKLVKVCFPKPGHYKTQRRLRRLLEALIGDAGIGGCREFWLLNEKRKQIKVSTPDGVTRTYSEGQEIPLTLFGGSLKVSAVFAE
jgi:Uma2 family endonuclease